MSAAKRKIDPYAVAKRCQRLKIVACGRVLG